MNSKKEIINNIDQKTLLDLIQQSFSVNGLTFSESKELAMAMILEHKLTEVPAIGSGGSLKVYLTHDIDWIHPHHLYSIIKTLSFRKDWIGISKLFQPNIFLKNIEKLIIFEKSQKVNSVFNIGANHSNFTWGRYDIRYRIKDTGFQELIGVLKLSNQPIGIHSQDNFDLKEQIELLQNVTGYEVRFHRSHFYHFDPMILWNELDENGIMIDFSIGNAREVGFKTGMPRHYQAIDFINKKVLRTMIVPTILSDNAFFFQDKNSVFEQFKIEIKEAKLFGASVAILFHPENMIVKPELWEYYTEIIDICKNEGAVFN